MITKIITNENNFPLKFMYDSVLEDAKVLLTGSKEFQEKQALSIYNETSPCAVILGATNPFFLNSVEIKHNLAKQFPFDIFSIFKNSKSNWCSFFKSLGLSANECEPLIDYLNEYSGSSLMEYINDIKHKIPYKTLNKIYSISQDPYFNGSKKPTSKYCLYNFNAVPSSFSESVSILIRSLPLINVTICEGVVDHNGANQLLMQRSCKILFLCDQSSASIFENYGLFDFHYSDQNPFAKKESKKETILTKHLNPKNDNEFYINEDLSPIHSADLLCRALPQFKNPKLASLINVVDTVSTCSDSEEYIFSNNPLDVQEIYNDSGRLLPLTIVYLGYKSLYHFNLSFKENARILTKNEFLLNLCSLFHIVNEYDVSTDSNHSCTIWTNANLHGFKIK